MTNFSYFSIMSTHYGWSNSASVIINSMVLTPILALFAITFTAGKIHWSFALLLNVVAWWLYIELIWDSIVRVRLEGRTIIVSKPYRKNSLLMRSKNRQLVIRDEDWDQLFYFHTKDATSFYFRQGRTAAYYFTASSFISWHTDFQTLFPDKRFKESIDKVPKKLLKALQKEFPERVL